MSFVSYNGNIPNPNDNPSDDVGIMQSNSAAINTLLAVDHVSFNLNNGGYHNIIHQVPVGSVPSGISGIGQLYSQVPTGNIPPGGLPELFFMKPDGYPVRMTGGLSNANGYTWCSAFLFQWGTKTIPAAGPSGPYTFPVTFPGGCFVVVATVVSSPSPTLAGLYVTSKNASGFSVNSNASMNISYIAIGL